MKELTTEHLAAYLPYGVRCVYQTGNGMGEHASVIESIDMSRPYSFGTAFWPMNDLKKCKLILRPLSDLTREITHNGDTFVPMDVLHRDFPQAAMYYGQQTDANNLPYCIMKQLLTWHVDIFELTESNLAIDINTIKPQSK